MCIHKCILHIHTYTCVGFVSFICVYVYIEAEIITNIMLRSTQVKKEHGTMMLAAGGTPTVYGGLLIEGKCYDCLAADYF